MKHTKYEVIFLTGRIELEYAFRVNEAIILAQANQIKKGNDYTVASVVNVKTREVVFQLLEKVT